MYLEKFKMETITLQEINASPVDLRQFVIQNAAKEFRDKVTALYDELICVKISDILTSDTGEGIFS